MYSSVVQQFWIHTYEQMCLLDPAPHDGMPGRGHAV